MFAALATCVWLATTPPAAEPAVVEPAHVYTSDTRIAVVASELVREVSFAVAHCDALQRYLEYTLGMPALPLPLARIEVINIAGFAPVEIRVVTGTVLVVTRFDDPVQAPSHAATAAASAWLARAALAAGQPITVSEGWVRQALACEVLVQLRPAMNDFWYREGRRSAPSPLVDILAGRAPEQEAFLFWRAFRQVVGPPESQVKALIASAQGGSAAALLKTLGRNPQEWWLMARAELLISRSPVSLGVRESAESLDDISRFVFDLGKGDELLTGADLAKHRELPAIRTSLAGRLASLRREILRQNPVYHNAWRTFGAWLEGFSGESPEEVAKLWADYVEERRQADALRREVEAALVTPAVK